MAPEVLTGDGYTFSVDYWSIAVCMYEFVCGGLPYGEMSNDPMEIYLAIINNELVFPKFVNDKEFIDLVSNMMSKNYRSRICNYIQIKSHPYFSNFDWDGLNEMTISVPYLPKSQVDNIRVTQTYNHFIQNNSSGGQNLRSNKYDQEFVDWVNNF